MTDTETLTEPNILEGLRPLLVPIGDLKPLPGNPRKGDVDAVARSYQTFGQRKPIVAKRDGTVIAGNHQLAAALQLGWSHIAVVYADDDDATAKAYALADNRVGDLGTYDDDALAVLIRDLEGEDTLIAATGYGEDDVARLLARLDEPVAPTGSKGLGEPVVSYTIIFDDDGQQTRWYEYVRWLRTNMEGATVAERLDRHLTAVLST